MPAQDQADTRESQQDPMAILLVEDSKLQAGIISEELRRFHYQVHVASNGVEALELLHRELIDILITDIEMPDMNGLELITSIRATKKFSELPIIAVSSLDQEGVLKEVVQQGADDFIAKPIKMNELNLRISNVLGKKDAIRKNHTLFSQLLQSEKMASIGILASGVAHELNNPLTGIIGFAESILKKKYDLNKIMTQMTKIVHSSQRMKKIIDHLRSYSRKSSIDDREAICLNDVVQASFILLANQLKKKHIAWELNLKKDLPLI